MLRISSDRRGVVYLNGKNVGTVKPGQSLRLDVQTGRQTVRFVPEGGNPVSETVNVSEGDVFEHKL
ncbi:MAG: PEGA domain-containing protein [Deltaproteobacteria bacterium]|nr:PEGA domain-containing protein [Deltaproteobacteria bacterium]